MSARHVRLDGVLHPRGHDVPTNDNVNKVNSAKTGTNLRGLDLMTPDNMWRSWYEIDMWQSTYPNTPCSCVSKQNWKGGESSSGLSQIWNTDLKPIPAGNHTDPGAEIRNHAHFQPRDSDLP